MVQPGGSRCPCSRVFSLHLTVMILGIVGVVVSVLVVVAAFLTDHDRDTGNANSVKGSSFWLLGTTILIFVSGLQGLLVHQDTGCFNCHVILAVFNLVNLAVVGVSCLFIANVFWITYIALVYVFELWVTILRTCCKPGHHAGHHGLPHGTEMPTANPAEHMPAPAEHHVVGIPVTSQPDPVTYKVDPRHEAAGAPHPHGND